MEFFSCQINFSFFSLVQHNKPYINHIFMNVILFAFCYVRLNSFEAAVSGDVALEYIKGVSDILSNHTAHMRTLLFSYTCSVHCTLY